MEISNYNKKMKAMNEVTWMRCFLAFLIVFFHSFLCFDGRWKPFEGIIDIPIYRWLSRISFSYTLEAFVLISGYIFAFQHITLQREERLEGLVWNKLKRLILPSILFSAVYFLLFIDYYGPANMLYRIVNGCGHMWYLPMLFWCFLGGWFLEKIKINDSKKLFFLALLSINSIRHLPFSFDRTLHYLVFFWGGYVLYQHKDRLQSKLNGKRLLFGWIFFAVVFFLLRNMQADLNFTTSNSYLTRVAENLCQLLY